MYAQFLARYPTGSLVTELLQIHQHQYVVRAVVQVSGTTLATGMAAASTIEQAEDQARARALVVLGVYLPSYETQAHLESATPQAQLNPARPTLEDRSSWMSTDVETAEGESVEYTHRPSSYRQPDLLAHPPNSSAEFAANDYPIEQNHEQPESNKSRKNGRVAPMPPPPAAPVDLSDIIAQTTIELKRLGWNEVQGRTHLMAAYGKRSRQQLTDEELLEFLDYLKSQPSEPEPSF